MAIRGLTFWSHRTALSNSSSLSSEQRRGPMCSCDWDPPEFSRTLSRVARKVHKCYECARKISPGERYQSVSGKWSGQLSQFNICVGCSAGIEWLSEECGCWEYGNVAQG